jgi:hypothetical protein
MAFTVGSLLIWCRNSSVVIVTGYTAEAGDFSVLHSVQTGSGAHTASCPVGTGGSSFVGKGGREADQSPVTNAEVKNGGAILPLPHYVFMASTGTLL